MNRRARLAPYAHAVLHAHNMLWELLLTPLERRVAARDRARLEARHPFLLDYERRAAAHRYALRESYAAYTTTVSPALVTISLELAAFLAVTCEALRPESILDLGSGFSSYVFRTHAKRADAHASVCSVDESQEWLDRTARFLRERQLEHSDLVTLDALLSRKRRQFDLILLDIGDLTTRQQLLSSTLAVCRPGGMLVIDDMHVPRYRAWMTRELRRWKLEHFSLRALTRKRLRYAYLVVV
jgi:predicted O-methyltransferase YrrM